MGLFDSLKSLSKIVDSVEKSLGDIVDSAKPAGGENSSVPAPAPVQQVPVYSEPVSSPMNVEQKFDEIFAAEFSDCQVIKNADPQSVGISAPIPCRPYTYALLRGGQPVLVILLTQHNRDRNAAFLNAKRSAMNSSVKFLNFYTHYPNERGYVVTRIRSAL